MAELVSEKRLAGPMQPGVSSGVLFTVPANHIYVIKQIILCNPDALDHSVTLGVGDSTTVANRFVSELSIKTHQVVTIDTHMVFAAGETLTALTNVAAMITVSVTGWDHQLI